MKLYQALIAGLVACSFAIADSTTTTTTTATKKAKTTAVKVQSFTGTVVSTDLVGNTVIVSKKAAKKEIIDTFSITDKTKYAPKGMKIDSVTTDRSVTVGYMVEDGKMVAGKITVNVPAKAKKAKPVKAPAAPTAPATGSTGQ